MKHFVFSSARRYYNKSEESFSSKKCLTWFKVYTTSLEPDILGPEGMEKFCKDISVDPENVVMLVLAYKMGAKQMGYFSQYEWLKGLTEIQCDTASKVQSKLDYLKQCLDDPNMYKSIYRYAYDFARVSFLIVFSHISLLFLDHFRTKTRGAWIQIQPKLCCKYY